MKSRLYYTEAEVEVTCCDHCHGDARQCKGEQQEKSALDMIDRFLAGQADRVDLVRFARQHELRAAAVL